MCEKFEEEILLNKKGRKLNEEVAEHISMCPTCRVLFEKNKEINSLIEEDEFLEVPENFNKNVFDKIEKLEGEKFEIERKKINLRLIQTIAASIIFIVSIFLTGMDLNKTKKEIPYSISDLKQEKLLDEMENISQNNEVNILSTYDKWNINN